MPIKLFILFWLSMCFSAECLSQEISMHRGFGIKYYEGEIKISKRKVGELMMSDQEASRLWKKYNRQEKYTLIAAASSLGFLAWQNHRLWAHNREGIIWPTIGTIASGVSVVYFGLSYWNLRKKAILRYNQSLEEAPAI